MTNFVNFLAYGRLMVAIKRGDAIASFDLASMAKNDIAIYDSDFVMMLVPTATAAAAAYWAGQIYSLNRQPILAAMGTNEDGSGWSAFVETPPDKKAILAIASGIAKARPSGSKRGLIAIGAVIDASDHHALQQLISAASGLSEYLDSMGFPVTSATSATSGAFTSDGMSDTLADELSLLLGDDSD